MEHGPSCGDEREQDVAPCPRDALLHDREPRTLNGDGRASADRQIVLGERALRLVVPTQDVALRPSKGRVFVANGKTSALGHLPGPVFRQKARRDRTRPPMRPRLE